MIILDTHAWLWWVNESDKLAPHAGEIIQGADQIGICAISCWEVAMLIAKDRLGLSMDVQVWIDLALQVSLLSCLLMASETGFLSPIFVGQPEMLIETRFLYAIAND